MTTLEILLPAITTIGGAIIGATASYLVSRMQFTTSVISKARQEWINILRDNLAEYHSIIYDYNINCKTEWKFCDKQEGIKALKHVKYIRSRVLLLMNPEESDNVSLIEIMGLMCDEAAQPSQQSKDNAFTELESKFVSVSQKILKKEWEKMKQGK